MTALTWLVIYLGAAWSFLGLFIWRGYSSDTIRLYKKAILFVICGPILWCFYPLFYLFAFMDNLFVMFEEWIRK
jgi:hypothetical protein